ncbi:FAD-dependent urate hydroxylase HpxO [Pseudomonas sp. CFBP 13719]|uniref:FAD-dependent urate hydroxylase HpxO n=1 Tax=Pseudomonas sp. CFBP 13719 TaxID=2775303 RepID=UPI001780FBC1|nr:FAD-dependent urate hydroxylase HpxO [Pseudomonas sp. CFBP 13719]MBD8682934.1 FAD-dependent urate hydroxylase HpxO [Pseudomonas sp. CFBP 13719]
MESLNIVIAGAGMGGLSAAAALQQAGHRVHVYERAAELAPVGAAISIWPNGVRVLDALGLGESIERAGGHMQSMSYSDHQDRLLTRFDLQPLYNHARRRAFPIARARLQGILLEAVGMQNVTLGVACLDYEESQTHVQIMLSTGETVTADLLIAANGTHSVLRDKIAGRPIPRRYCGYVNWNGRIRSAADLAPADEWVQYVGEHKRVSLMPMGNGELYYFFDVPLPAGTPNVREDYSAELEQHFADWPEPVQRLLQRLDPAGVARVEIHDTERVPRLVGARVALLGDAAHAMTPNIGQGGCQAMEDAWVLARCIEREQTPAAALAAYETARAERVAALVIKARERAAIIHGEVPEDTRQWYAALAGSDGSDILGGLIKTDEGSPL